MTDDAAEPSAEPSAGDHGDLPTRGHKKKARTRALLVQAAIDAIAEQPGGFSVGDVTRRAGVSQGTFYNYFDDRDALIDAVIPEILTNLSAGNAALVDLAKVDDPAQRFAIQTALVLAWAGRSPEEVRVLLRLDAVHQMIVEAPALDHLRADLLNGLEAGAFDVGPDAATLDVIVGALFLAARRIVDEPLPDAYAITVVAQLLRTLGIDRTTAAQIAGDGVRVAADLASSLLG